MFSGDRLLNSKPISVLCRAFTLLCHSNSFFIIADMALGFSLVALLGMGRESAQSDVFLAPALCLFAGLCFTACVMFACGAKSRTLSKMNYLKSSQ